MYLFTISYGEPILNQLKHQYWTPKLVDFPGGGTGWNVNSHPQILLKAKVEKDFILRLRNQAHGPHLETISNRISDMIMLNRVHRGRQDRQHLWEAVRGWWSTHIRYIKANICTRLVLHLNAIWCWHTDTFIQRNAGHEYEKDND